MQIQFQQVWGVVYTEFIISNKLLLELLVHKIIFSSKVLEHPNGFLLGSLLRLLFPAVILKPLRILAGTEGLL